MQIVQWFFPGIKTLSIKSPSSDAKALSSFHLGFLNFNDLRALDAGYFGKLVAKVAGKRGHVVKRRRCRFDVAISLFAGREFSLPRE